MCTLSGKFAALAIYAVGVFHDGEHPDDQEEKKAQESAPARLDDLD